MCPHWGFLTVEVKPWFVQGSRCGALVLCAPACTKVLVWDPDVPFDCAGSHKVSVSFFWSLPKAYFCWRAVSVFGATVCTLVVASVRLLGSFEVLNVVLRGRRKICDISSSCKARYFVHMVKMLVGVFAWQVQDFGDLVRFWRFCEILLES